MANLLNLQAQNLDSLFVDYQDRSYMLIKEKIDLYREKKGFAFLSLLPSVSHNYNPSTNGGFWSVNFGISNFVRYAQRRKSLGVQTLIMYNRELERIEYKLIKFKEEIEKLKVQEVEIEELKELFKIEKQITEIMGKKYENNQITLLEWLQVQKSEMTLKNKINAKQKTYEIKRNKLINQLSDRY